MKTLTEPAKKLSVLLPDVMLPLIVLGGPVDHPPVRVTLKVAQPLGPVVTELTFAPVNGSVITRASVTGGKFAKISMFALTTAPAIGFCGLSNVLAHARTVTGLLTLLTVVKPLKPPLVGEYANRTCMLLSSIVLLPSKAKVVANISLLGGCPVPK